MNLSLAELQEQFAKSLHYQAKGEQCDIVSDTFSADERMQIYRNNFIISLSEVLQTTYPMVTALIGEECFEQIARQHVLTHPLTVGDVSHYGDGFESTILLFDEVAKAAPYCAEVARFEWAQDLAQQKYNTQQIRPARPLAHLATLNENQHGDIRFQLHPDVMLFQSEYSLFSLQHAINNHQFDGLNINLAEQGVIACHRDGTVWAHTLEHSAYRLLSDIQYGQPLSAIAEPLLAQLNVLIELNLIAGFYINELLDTHRPEHH
ncbi:DUF2063 domain-containing protein [Vibrio sinensis]|uniref:DUF2063 domain-containing protein n=1 Tax=Vibrio sinensis TaxID=2302434 RepID=A0A3A6QNK8_9VIBR|nr:DNA-binding domain-containing protein [Vibrio sinensis]RJX68798.1 DUF2063 domain-containing protein [Vibrio sinensis]